MKKVALIGIAGPKHVGKSTLAKFMARHVIPRVLGCSAGILPFAQPVKDVAHMMGWNGEKDWNGRKLLQIIGGAGRDLIREDVWAQRWADTVTLDTSSLEVVIADDMRYDNEARAVRRLAENLGIPSLLIEVEGRTEYTREHSSEMGVDRRLVDVVLNNRDWDGFNENNRQVLEGLVQHLGEQAGLLPV